MENMNTQTGNTTVSATFPDRDSAERAFQAVEDRGYTKDDINLVMNKDTRKRYFDEEHEEVHTELGSKAMEGAGLKLPLAGKAFVSVNSADKGQAVLLARRLTKLGFDLVATYGTANRLKEVGLECETVFKVNEGRPNIADLIMQGDIALIINTPLGKVSFFDEQAIRKAALQFNTPCVTTITGAEALVEAITTKLTEKQIIVRSLQEIHAYRSKASQLNPG